MQQWLAPLVVALIAPLVTYLIAAKKLSGRIDTSEAGKLWEEAGIMRAEYRQRAEECENNLKACRNEISSLIASNTSLRRELDNFRKGIGDVTVE